jgi:hypothetical protein
MDDTGNRATESKEGRMNAEFWFELILVVVRVLAAGLAD